MLPMSLQQVLSFFSQVLGTIMAGSLGDTAVSAVSLGNQPYFIFTVFTFGLASGGSVLISQYWGKGNIDAVRGVMSISMRFVAVISILYSVVCFAFPGEIIGIFSNDQLIITESVSYLRVVVFSYFLNGIGYCYLTAIQATENVKAPTIIYSCSIVLNFVFNYLLIYGNMGFPRLGIIGAAVGTIIARGFELLAAIVYGNFIEQRIKFRFRHLLIFSNKLIPDFVKISLPVVGNDLVWSLWQSVQVAIIGNISSTAVTAVSIAIIAQQFAMIVMYGMTSAVSIMIGKAVGSGDTKSAKRMGRIFLVIAFFAGLSACGTILVIRKPLMLLYPEISQQSRELAYGIMGIMSVTMISYGIETISIIGILRGAGDTRRASAIDAGCMWLIGFPLGMLAAFVWKLPVLFTYACLRIDTFVKIILCLNRILRGNYIKNVTREI